MMREPVIRLVFCCCERDMIALMCQVAQSLGLGHQSSPDLLEAIRTTHSDSSALLVVEEKRVHGVGLCRFRQAALGSRNPSICIGRASMDSSISAAISCGAICYLSADQAKTSLVHLVETVSRVMSAKHQDASLKRTTISLGANMVMLLPDYAITDGVSVTSLPRIAGKLLEYLACRPGEVLSVDDLVVAGWGEPSSANASALYQQIYLIRDALGSYGARGWLTCKRGKGYTLESEPASLSSIEQG